ncbi:endonuclease/exonuclease/phosphatase family domain-containing protein 1-like [Uloborus diversus]|uniref:endonuclease/exonuclease/phosphatase family domain-containing protein 1-like n=1 Tax=Uloborus diversus TaxID=327109 RepID=UPI00240A70BA|nr:endonuclease/exonuclease/phosphatase family domain-containing protein 1-like [Uloborus diversus]
MGQCISVPHHKSSMMHEGSTKRFYRSRNGNLSATFHVLDSDMKWDLININTATEEQLMTLPGINRVTAENIVEYRQRIGGFKRVEDLALVSGVGANRLEQFRTEITVGRRKINNSSRSSSLTQSLESLQTNETNVKPSPSKLVNVNSANVFQLMSVTRMTQEMAANIVHYRERKGPFKSIDELSKVKGLPPDRLAIVKMYLTVDSSSNVINSSSVHNKMSQNCLYGRRAIGHCRTNSAPSGLEKLRSYDPSTKDFYELVSSLITRPPVSEVFSNNYLGRQVFRLASWNLQDFVIEKAKNPGVQEVMARTILENGFSLIAVQEVASREALSLIASELNEPKLYPVKSWKGDRGKWHSLVSSHVDTDNSHQKSFVNGFLYDTSRGLQLQDSSVLYIPKEKMMGVTIKCQPFLGYFKIKNMDFVVVTFSLISESCVAKLLPSLLEQLKERIQVFEVLCGQGYTQLVPVESSSDNENWQEESHIWSSLNVRKIYSGRSGVVLNGLSHLAIPNGWKWGGSVSKHCPVWAEVFTEEDSNGVSSLPLSNGISKIPVLGPDVIADAINENISTLSDKNKEKCKGFWDRTWTWRYNHRQHVTCEKTKVLGKENGCL